MWQLEMGEIREHRQEMSLLQPAIRELTASRSHNPSLASLRRFLPQKEVQDLFTGPIRKLQDNIAAMVAVVTQPTPFKFAVQLIMVHRASLSLSPPAVLPRSLPKRREQDLQSLARQ